MNVLRPAWMAAVIYLVFLVVVAGSVDFVQSLRLAGDAGIAMTAARSYLGTLYYYGFMAVLSIPFFLLAAGIFKVLEHQVRGPNKDLAAFALIPLLVGGKVVLDAWFHHPVWESKALLFCFVAANALACASIGIQPQKGGT